MPNDQSPNDEPTELPATDDDIAARAVPLVAKKPWEKGKARVAGYVAAKSTTARVAKKRAIAKKIKGKKHNRVLTSPAAQVAVAKELGYEVLVAQLKGAGIMAEIPGEHFNKKLVVLDEDALFTAAKTHMSFEELGVVFGVAPLTLAQHPYYRPIIDRARAFLTRRLREAQIRNACDNDNAVLQVWLGKQLLDQKDVSRVENTGKDGQPQEHVVTRRVTAAIPDNGRDTPPAPAASGD